MQRCLLRNHFGTPYSIKRDIFSKLLTSWFGDDIINLGHLLLSEFTSTLVQVDLGDLASEVGETSADTLDNSESKCNLVPSVDVGILHTKNVLKVISVLNNEACLQSTISNL